MNYTREQFYEKFKKLPSEVRDAIVSVDVAEIIQAIAKKHNLPIDKMGELADETGLVMFGVTNPKDFIRNLYERLDVGDKEKVRQIAHEVNEQVFAKIRESLKQVHQLGSMNHESGIMNNELTNSVVPQPSAIETKEEMVEKIEHPEKDIIKDKLEKMNVMPKEESEYEMKINGNNKKKLSADPYREPTE